jgi:ribose-phosphate pyrophosphokinase
MIIKQRAGPGLIDKMHLIGDVRNRDVIIYDDMIDTGGTLCKAA